MRLILQISVLAALLLGSAPAYATDPALAAKKADIDHQQEYDACMKLAREKPEEGYKSGLAWYKAGGGFAARHCVAVALLELHQYDEAAARLERLAVDMGMAKTDLLIGILSQAGQAWFLAGRDGKALRVQSNLVEIQPNDPNLWLDRAMTLMDMEKYRDALTDIDSALRLNSGMLEARVYRAVALRQLDKVDEAWGEIQTVLAADPSMPAALLERGILRQLKGDLNGARADWLAVIRVAPDSETASAARARIEQMDVVVR